MAVALAQRDLDDLRGGFAHWFSQRVGEPVEVAPLGRPSAGLSSDTVFVEAAGIGSFVARLPPAGDGLFPTYDLERQARIQQRLWGSAVPVAEVEAIELDPQWVGAPFLVLRRVPGRTVSTNPPFLRKGWLHEATAAEQAHVHESFVRALVAVHKTDPRSVGEPTQADLRGELERWSAYLDWATDGAPPAVLRDGLRWCRQHRPEDDLPVGLVWGDVQLANTVIGDDLAVAAVLDWELAGSGPAELDIGWHLALHGSTVEACGGDLPGFPDRARFLGRYEELLGRSLVDVDWFEAFALVRSGAIMTRVAALLRAVGVDDSWLLGANPQFDRLARILHGHP